MPRQRNEQHFSAPFHEGLPPARFLFGSLRKRSPYGVRDRQSQEIHQCRARPKGARAIESANCTRLHAARADEQSLWRTRPGRLQTRVEHPLEYFGSLRFPQIARFTLSLQAAEDLPKCPLSGSRASSISELPCVLDEMS